LRIFKTFAASALAKKMDYDRYRREEMSDPQDASAVEGGAE